MKRKASPADAPGSVRALTASTTTSITSDGIRIRAAFSIPRTPLATTKTPRPMASAWKSSAWGVELKASQNCPGAAVGISPLTVAKKNRIVQPMTTV